MIYFSPNENPYDNKIKFNEAKNSIACASFPTPLIPWNIKAFGSLLLDLYFNKSLKIVLFNSKLL